MNKMNRRSFVVGLATGTALSLRPSQPSRVVSWIARSLTESVVLADSPLPPLQVAIVGSFVIFVDAFNIKIFTPVIPDRDGHIFFVSANNNTPFVLDPTEKDYSLTGIAPVLRKAPTLKTGGGTDNIDPTLAPVLANVAEPSDNMYQFSITLPFPDDIILENPISKATDEFFAVPRKPDLMELPTQLPTAYRFVYNAYRPSGVGLNGHHFDFGASQPRINIVSKAVIPDSVTAECSDSVLHDMSHPQAAMKALGDMVQKEIFLNKSYCGKSFGSIMDKLHIALPDHLTIGGKTMSLDKAAADRAPGCFGLVATSP